MSFAWKCEIRVMNKLVNHSHVNPTMREEEDSQMDDSDNHTKSSVMMIFSAKIWFSQTHIQVAVNSTHTNPMMDHLGKLWSGEQFCTLFACNSVYFYSCPWPRRQVYITWVGPQHQAVKWPPCRARKEHIPLMMMEDNW